MIVMKFGGTSVEDAASIARVVEIVRGRLPRGPAVVVSAMGKTTRRLLDAAEASAAGDSTRSAEILDELLRRHVGEARRAAGPGARKVEGWIAGIFDELGKLLMGLSILSDVPPRGLDKILAYGELLSSAILGAALAAAGIRSRLLDARELVKTDDRFGNAAPLVDPTYDALRAALLPLVEAGQVPVVQGFIGSTRSGATTTLGFEGSDFTAALVGAACSAEEIEIWKDVTGLMTADPAVIAEARTVRACSFAEAAVLTFFGAKVLHPKAVHPAAERNIPVRIYNSRDPAAGGTTITSEAPRSSNAIKSIAYKRPVTLLQLQQPAATMAASETLLEHVMRALGAQGAFPLLVAASARDLAIATEPLRGTAFEELVADLPHHAPQTAVRGARAIITLVGEELRDWPGILDAVAEATRGIPLDLALSGPSAIAVHLVLAEAQVEEAVARLHARFFAQVDPQVFA